MPLPVLSTLDSVAQAILKTRREGDRRGLKEDAKWLAKFPLYSYLQLTAGVFALRGRSHRYVYHPYNNTWRNERCVEVALGRDLLAAHTGARVLEVGNVLAHYMPTAHTVVDKYEKAPGVLNEDVISYSAPPFDLILSLSTLEHVGWDEQPRQPEKIEAAFANLLRLRKPEGHIVVTLPMGYNAHADALIKSDGVPGYRWMFMARDKSNRWSEVGPERAQEARFDAPYPSANVLAIGLAGGEPGPLG